MDERKIAFLICVNNETYYEECINYIERLHVPDGFLVEAYAIREALSIYQAYNWGMQQTDAKYKIYMHQDVFLIYQDLLIECITMFRDNPEIGMIGMLGTDRVPEDNRFYKAWNQGNVIGCSDRKAFWNELGKKAVKVLAIDGMFMMTQYDIPWREDVLKGWDFYDFSQSIEFRKAGYAVWVAPQTRPWSIHDCGCLNLTHYDEQFCDFLRVYGEEFPKYERVDGIYPKIYRERFSMMMELKQPLKVLLADGQTEQVEKVLAQADDERFYDTELWVIRNVLEICTYEKQMKVKKGFLEDCRSFEELYEKYIKVKFYLWREKYAPDLAGISPDVSEEARKVIYTHSMLPE